VVRNDRLARMKRISCRRRHVGPDGRAADHIRPPTNSGANQEPIVFRQVL
jgi:hypothetical protein